MDTKVARTPSIYIASKTRHAHRWRFLRDQTVRVVSTWIDEAGVGETKDRGDLWTRCIGEAAEADALMLYVEAGEIIKGALVEMGAALAIYRPVLWIGPVGDYTATAHPLVRLYETVPAALRSLGYYQAADAYAASEASHG